MRFKISKAISRLCALAVASALLAGCAVAGTTVQSAEASGHSTTDAADMASESSKAGDAASGSTVTGAAATGSTKTADAGFSPFIISESGSLPDCGWQYSVSFPDWKGAPDATTDTLYDLASITKMFGVNYAFQKLVTDGEIDLDASVSDYLGERFYEDVIDITYEKGANPDLETQKEWKASLTLRDLLLHQGGFPSDPRYFNPHLNTEKQEYDPNGTNLLFAGNSGDEETREATFDAICRTPLLYEPGTQTLYSDVDYMILGEVVEQVTGKGLDTYLKETFLEPMGLTHMTYTPLEHGFTKENCAATELNGNTRDGVVDFPGIRTETLQGTVHDEKAYYSMGGVSGQLLSLLFSMTEDSLKFIPEGASSDHPAVKSAQSLLSVYTARAEKTGDPGYEDQAAVLQEKLDSLVN